jgi:hypothetical protein
MLDVLNGSDAIQLDYSYSQHSKNNWPKFVKKRLNAPSLISATDFGRISSKLAKIRLMFVVGFFAPLWVKFGQFGKISVDFGVSSAKIGGGN